jgi:rhamnulokinase
VTVDSDRPGGIWVAAVDLGASSGRVFAAELRDGLIEIEEVSRFPNGGVDVDGVFRWQLRRLYEEVVAGLSMAARAALLRGGVLVSAGIDSWAVDYGRVGTDGRLLEDPVHHRDSRTHPAFEAAVAAVGGWKLFERSGIALLSFNTLYQLLADRSARPEDETATVLLIPDLLGYLLTGRSAWEKTNSSTTQLLTVSREWDTELMEMLSIPPSIVGDLTPPGTVLGPVSDPAALEAGVPPDLLITSVASHDTASAVLAVPAVDERFAFISSGTWSLVGVEIDEPVVTRQAFEAGYSNELGAFGKTRLLRNIMGFWPLQEVIREFEGDGVDLDLAALMLDASSIPRFQYLIDAESSVLLTTGDMRGRIAELCGHDRPAPRQPAEFARCILDSLALAYRRAIRGIEEVAARRVDTIHIVGGGAMNEQLCQMTADACGVPVEAGPIEAAAIGNALMQFRALDLVDDDLWGMRWMVRRSFGVLRFEPDPSQGLLWQSAEESLSTTRVTDRLG